MSNQKAIQLVAAFNSLESTPEKDDISRRFLLDEIGPLEFYQLASRYIDKVREQVMVAAK